MNFKFFSLIFAVWLTAFHVLGQNFGYGPNPGQKVYFNGVEHTYDSTFLTSQDSSWHGQVFHSDTAVNYFISLYGDEFTQYYGPMFPYYLDDNSNISRYCYDDYGVIPGYTGYYSCQTYENASVGWSHQPGITGNYNISSELWGDRTFHEFYSLGEVFGDTISPFASWWSYLQLGDELWNPLEVVRYTDSHPYFEETDSNSYWLNSNGDTLISEVDTFNYNLPIGNLEIIVMAIINDSLYRNMQAVVDSFSIDCDSMGCDLWYLDFPSSSGGSFQTSGSFQIDYYPEQGKYLLNTQTGNFGYNPNQYASDKKAYFYFKVRETFQQYLPTGGDTTITVELGEGFYMFDGFDPLSEMRPAQMAAFVNPTVTGGSNRIWDLAIPCSGAPLYDEKLTHYRN